MLAYLLIPLLVTVVTSQMTGFMVGGKPASIKDWPFIAFLLAYNEDMEISSCGGSLISSQTVLTAAHCLDDVTNKKQKFGEISYTIFMGHTLHRKATMLREVLDYVTHERYDSEDVYYDVGVMFLSKPVEFSPTVKKVLLMNQEMGQTMAGEGGLMVAGWGKYRVDSPGSDFLKSLDQTLINEDLCYTYIDDIERAPGIVCGGKLAQVNSTEYAFSGDSGGPLARPRDQLLAGLVSWRMETHGLTVYTSVPYFYTWIKETQYRLFRLYCPKGL